MRRESRWLTYKEPEHVREVHQDRADHPHLEDLGRQLIDQGPVVMAPEPLEPDDPTLERTSGPGQERGQQTGNGFGGSSAKSSS